MIGSLMRGDLRFSALSRIVPNGPGDDTYIVDQESDVVDETGGGGIDTVLTSINSTKLGDATMFKGDIENVTAVEGSAAYELVGNGLDNVLRGNSAPNQINGSGGDDTMIGGGGSDFYFIDSAGDIVDEQSAGGTGTDLVISPFTVDIATAQFLGAIENIRLVEAQNSNAFGNALGNEIFGNDSANQLDGRAGNDTLDGAQGNDTLFGGEGNDTLIGGLGADTLRGGNGNDTYLNPSADTIQEASGPTSGNDTVQSDASFTLGANVERLILTGTAPINGTGNGLANLVVGTDTVNLLAGGDGNDTLNGGGGADTINGGTGADRLLPGLQRDKILPGSDAVQDTVVFNTIGESTGVTRDVLSGFDFNAEDKIDLPVVPTSFAGAIGTGTLSTASFNADLVAAVTAAKLGAGQAVLFNPNAGDLDQPGMVYLIVDRNGVAGYQANQDWVFQLENHAGTLDPTDFI